MTAALSRATNATLPVSRPSVGEGIARVSLATLAGTVICGGVAAYFHRTPAAIKAGLAAGAIGGAVTGVASLNLVSSDALKFGLIVAGVGGALAASIMPGLHGMPVSPRAAAFEVAIAGAVLGGIGGGIADIVG
ncbi:MAG: hypothetical protein H7123_00145 [Thermoleophilia bacterium]|nr:hypothetical protein [Thermoleophilia bacterium]